MSAGMKNINKTLNLFVGHGDNNNEYDEFDGEYDGGEYDDPRYKGGSGRRSTVIQFKQTFRSFKGRSWLVI